MMQEQHRKRLVALAQAQQQQILAAAKNKTINTNNNYIQSVELNRNNSDMNFNGDVKMLNKKMTIEDFELMKVVGKGSFGKV